MEQRLRLITLAVRDLDASRRCHLDGLGWTAALDVPGEVLMLKVADRVQGAPPLTAAGAEPVVAAAARDWGGYSGHVADPDGFRWEIAYNPGPIGQEVLS